MDMDERGPTESVVKSMPQTKQKMVALCLLIVAALGVFVIGTEAAYQTGFFYTARIETAGFDLSATDTATSSQTFKDLAVEPNKDYLRELRIDTSKCEVKKMDVSVTLTLNTNGTVPPGFSVTLDGQPVGESLRIDYPNAQDSVKFLSIAFRWNLDDGEDAQAYRDFGFSYTVDVEGRQTA